MTLALVKTVSRIDPNVSDLFFNHELDSCHQYDKDGQFIGYDHPRMLEEATIWCDTFERASGIKVDPAELVQDYYDRI